MAMGAAGVAAVLDGIQRAEVPRETRRFLLSRAVDRSVQALLGQLPAGKPEMNVASELEDALGEVSIASGNPRADVTSAKTWLRGRGAEGKALAAELGRLSTARNVWAHPRRNLLDRIKHVASDDAATLLRPEASALVGARGEELGAGFAQNKELGAGFAQNTEVDEKIHRRPNAALLEDKAGGIPVDKLEVQFGAGEVQPGEAMFVQACTAKLEADALVIGKLAARLAKLEEVLVDHSEFKERTTAEVEALGKLAAARVHELDQIHAKLGEQHKAAQAAAEERRAASQAAAQAAEALAADRARSKQAAMAQTSAKRAAVTEAALARATAARRATETEADLIEAEVALDIAQGSGEDVSYKKDESRWAIRFLEQHRWTDDAGVAAMVQLARLRLLGAGADCGPGP